MKLVPALALSLTLTTPAVAVESVTFSALTALASGSGIVYDGKGGPLSNGGGLDAPLGTEFNTVTLRFTTGPNIQEAPGLYPTGEPEQPYLWEGGGSFVFSTWFPNHKVPFLSGSVDGARLDAGPYNHERANWDDGLFVMWLTFDDGTQATLEIEIGLGYLLFSTGGSILSYPNRAIITPVAPVPEPTTLVLFGIGFAALGLFGMWLGRAS